MQIHRWFKRNSPSRSSMLLFSVVVVAVCVLAAGCFCKRPSEKAIAAPKQYLVISADDRLTEPFVQAHNKNVQEYTNRHPGYVYIFETGTAHAELPLYWRKVALVQEHLLTAKYEAVLWIDTDAFVIQQEKQLSGILAEYPDKHFFFGSDNTKEITHNAGIFMVRNSAEGRLFMQTWIDELKAQCKGTDGKYTLGKKWAQACYEQGKMNEMLERADIAKIAQFLPQNLFNSTYNCTQKNFILHRYGKKEGLLECIETNKQANR